MKLPGFPEKLGSFTMYRRLFPYAWGSNDCVTFPADAIWAMTGEDPIADIRGTWHDEESARAVIAEQGGLIGAADKRFKRHTSPSFATRGDLCMVKVRDEPSLAICVGLHAAAPGDDGMLLISMSEVLIAWRV